MHSGLCAMLVKSERWLTACKDRPVRQWQRQSESTDSEPKAEGRGMTPTGQTSKISIARVFAKRW